MASILLSQECLCSSILLLPIWVAFSKLASQEVRRNAQAVFIGLSFLFFPIIVLAASVVTP